MKLYVVRHVKAGSRTSWDGDDDRQRPVSKSGRRQADAIAARLAPEGVSQLVSSPYARCVQSLEPLAAILGLSVLEDERLAEGGQLERSLALAAEATDGTVLCSHGDVIPDLIMGLVRRGMELTTHRPTGARRRSGWSRAPVARSCSPTPPSNRPRRNTPDRRSGHPASHGPIWSPTFSADSGGGRDELVESFGWSIPSEGLAWAAVE